MQDQPAVATARGLAERPSTAALALAWCGGGLFLFALVYFVHSYVNVYARPAPAGPWIAPAFIDVALFSAFALHHSILARARIRTAVARVTGAPLERSVYTWTASVLFVVVCAAWHPVPGIVYELRGWAAFVGLAAQASGLLITFLGSRAIDVLDLAGVRQVIAARAGAERPRARLETSGLYRFVRHPIYLGWVLLVFGAPVMTATRFVFAIVSTAYLVIAIPFEERGLVGAFGRDYDEYRRRVRWRIVPGIW
jgi:methanethiol S-methyltransferase